MLNVSFESQKISYIYDWWTYFAVIIDKSLVVKDTFEFVLKHGLFLYLVLGIIRTSRAAFAINICVT